MEKINGLFHQPAHLEDPLQVKEFARDNYQEIKSLYYEILWNWLPDNIKEEFTES